MPDLQQALDSFFKEAIKGIHTALPARIVSFDTGTGKAVVKPVLRQELTDGTVIEYPEIVGVPVMFPRSSKFSLTYPLEQGDTVLLIFSERALSRWLSNGGVVEPIDPRRHDLSDAIAIPGLYPFSEGTTITAPDATEVTFDSASMILNSDGSIELSNDSGNLTLKSDGQLDVNSGNLTVDV